MAFGANEKDAEASNDRKPHIVCVCQILSSNDEIVACCKAKQPRDEMQHVHRDNKHLWCSRCIDLDNNRPVVCPVCTAHVRS